MESILARIMVTLTCDMVVSSLGAPHNSDNKYRPLSLLVVSIAVSITFAAVTVRLRSAADRSHDHWSTDHRHIYHFSHEHLINNTSLDIDTQTTRHGTSVIMTPEEMMQMMQMDLGSARREDFSLIEHDGQSTGQCAPQKVRLEEVRKRHVDVMKATGTTSLKWSNGMWSETTP